MENTQDASVTFEAEVTSRFGILPNFFRSAQAAPELLEQLWGFAKAGYLDNPMPSSAVGAIPDVILCDLGLPGGMDGFAVARA
jgi:CheY-like chemotaxis protein